MSCEKARKLRLYFYKVPVKHQLKHSSQILALNIRADIKVLKKGAEGSDEDRNSYREDR